MGWLPIIGLATVAGVVLLVLIGRSADETYRRQIEAATGELRTVKQRAAPQGTEFRCTVDVWDPYELNEYIRASDSQRERVKARAGADGRVRTIDPGTVVQIEPIQPTKDPTPLHIKVITGPYAGRYGVTLNDYCLEPRTPGA